MSAEPVAIPPCFFQHELRVMTEQTCGFHDITDDVAEFVRECRLQTGIVVMMSMHTTAGLLVNERETGFRKDFADFADRLAPREHPYRHDDLEVRFENLCPEDREFPNGHAHLQHTIFGGPSLVLPVDGMELVLGVWQRVFLLEYDRPRARRVRLQGFGMPMPTPSPPAGRHERLQTTNGAATA